jgi:hypothetical protein
MMENTTITYIDNPRVPIRFGTLIINVESIVKGFGSLEEFDRKYRPGGCTNGKLFYMHEMMWPPGNLLELREIWFKEAGLRPGIDGSVMQERQGRWSSRAEIHDDTFLFLGLPECKSAKFMRTLLTVEDCYAWHHSEVGEEYYDLRRGQYLLDKFLIKNEPLLMRMGPRCTFIDDDKLEYTVWGKKHTIEMDAFWPEGYL